MKKLTFKIDIGASRKKVWDTMLNPVTFKEWANAGWPGAYFEGNWKQGEKIRFLSPGRGGTLAMLVEEKPYEFILAKHIAVIDSNGSEDRNSDEARNWIGTTEAYTFIEKNGKSRLQVEMSTAPEWEKMATDGWPKALAKLKEICEN